MPMSPASKQSASGIDCRPPKHIPRASTSRKVKSILARDIAVAEAAVEHLVKIPLTQGQFDALVDFVFNLGAGRLAASTLLVYLNSGRYTDAAWQLLAWDHAGSKEIAGLKARREAEFKLWNPQSASQIAAA